MLKKILVSTICAASAFVAGTTISSPASAYAISTFTDPKLGTGTLPEVQLSSADIGSSFGVNYLNTTTAPNLSGSALFTVDKFTSSLLELTIKATNSTSTAGGFQASLMSLGLGVNPNATASIHTAGSVFDGAAAGSGPKETFPGGFKQIDVCVFAANGCDGGDVKDGLLQGATDTVTIDLTGSFGTDPATAMLLSFPVKFQTSKGAYEFAGTPVVPLPTPVPEPAALALLGTGLLGLGLVRRKHA